MADCELVQELPAVPVPSAQPIHRALDLVTALSLDVQRLQRQLNQEQPLRTVTPDAALIGIEEQLRQLGELLVQLRDKLHAES